jgi:hypothetical protein
VTALTAPACQPDPGLYEGAEISVDTRAGLIGITSLVDGNGEPAAYRLTVVDGPRTISTRLSVDDAEDLLGALCDLGVDALAVRP